MDNIAPTTTFAEINVEADLHDENELMCRPKLLRDGVVGPVSLVDADSISKHLFKDGHEKGALVPVFSVTTAIIYAAPLSTR